MCQSGSPLCLLCVFVCDIRVLVKNNVSDLSKLDALLYKKTKEGPSGTIVSRLDMYIKCGKVTHSANKARRQKEQGVKEKVFEKGVRQNRRIRKPLLTMS